MMTPNTSIPTKSGAASFVRYSNNRNSVRWSRLPRVFRHLWILGLLLPFFAQPLLADSQSDLKSRVKTFCDQKAKLTELSINFDVEKLVSLQAGSKAASQLNSVGTVQIAMMHCDCNLLVGGFITPEQFLGKQTEILQFAVDLQNVSKQAQAQDEATKAAANKTTSATAGTKPANPQASSSSQTESIARSAGETSKNKSEGTGPQTPEKGKSSQASKPANLDINAIAKDLGVELKNKVGVVQSGNENLVQSGMQRLIDNYSPIALSNR